MPELIQDGDNSVLELSHGVNVPDAPMFASTSKRGRPLVGKLGRTLNRGDHGSDVKGIKRALWRAKATRVPPKLHTNKFTKATEKTVKRFQKQHKLPQTGVYGPKTHRHLKKHFDAYAVWLYHHGKTKPKQTDIRTRLRALALYGISKNYLTGYTQGPSRWSGIDRRIRKPRVPPWSDCSAWTTYLYWHENGPDPNQLGFRAGYTGTQSTHGRRVSTSSVRAGDLCFYGGWWPFTHVLMAIGGGVGASHGSSRGPRLERINYRPISRICSYLP